jgi:hypothetical protein
VDLWRRHPRSVADVQGLLPVFHLKNCPDRAEMT